MKKLFIASALALAALSVQAATPQGQQAGNNLLLNVNGMVCAFCAQGIEKRQIGRAHV